MLDFYSAVFCCCCFHLQKRSHLPFCQLHVHYFDVYKAECHKWMERMSRKKKKKTIILFVFFFSFLLSFFLFYSFFTLHIFNYLELKKKKIFVLMFSHYCWNDVERQAWAGLNTQCIFDVWQKHSHSTNLSVRCCCYFYFHVRFTMLNKCVWWVYT